MPLARSISDCMVAVLRFTKCSDNESLTEWPIPSPVICRVPWRQLETHLPFS